jgi:hypothetical protein
MPETTSTLARERHRGVKEALPDSLQDQLNLNGTELRLLLRLLTWGSIARQQAAVTASVTLGSVNPTMTGLRKKLAKHHIKLITIRDFGWALPRESQSKIVGLIKPRGDTEAAGEKSRLGVEWQPKAQQHAQRLPEDP